MKVQFVVDCEIEVFESADEALEDAETTTETFNVGDTAEFDIFGVPQRFDGSNFVDDTENVNVQFGDGSVAFGLGRCWFKEIP